MHTYFWLLKYYIKLLFDLSQIHFSNCNQSSSDKDVQFLTFMLLELTLARCSIQPCISSYQGGSRGILIALIHHPEQINETRGN